MMETFKEELTNYLKEIERKTNKKWKEINKSFKETQEKAIKQVKQAIQTVQDMKIEIEAIKKTQTKGILEMENLGKGTGATDISITNRIQEMEEKISMLKIV